MIVTTTNSRTRRHVFSARTRRNHNLEEQAQALYKSWFVDFEPFKGGKFVESELGMIPEGWKVVSLRDIATLEKKTINPQKHTEIVFAHYSIPAYDNSELPETQKGSEIMSNKFEISDHSVLFSKLNPRIKRVWNIYKAKENSICSTEFVVYKAKSLNYYPFLFSVISGNDFYDNIMSKVNGATGSHQRFHPEETLDYMLPFNDSSYRLYCDIILPYIRTIEDNKQEILRLITLRDSLLPKLMSGELDINEIDC